MPHGAKFKPKAHEVVVLSFVHQVVHHKRLEFHFVHLSRGAWPMLENRLANFGSSVHEHLGLEEVNFGELL